MFQNTYQPNYGAYFGTVPRQPVYGTPMMPAAPQSTTAVNYSVQPVSSKEEALAVIADPISPGVLMPDLGHGVIYVKRFNANTGTSDFAEFSMVVRQVENEEPIFIRVDVFNETIKELKNEISALKKAKGVKTDDE